MLSPPCAAAILTVLFAGTVTSYLDFSMCPENRRLVENLKHSTLTMLNRVRQKAAQGEYFRGSATLPKARHIQLLTWDCDLERMAEQAVENCPQTETPNSLYAQSFMHARVSGRFDEQDTILPVQNPTEDAKLGFIIEGNAVMYNGFPTFKNYSNLLRANTTRVGCSSTNCYNEQNALVQTGVCFFNSPEMKKGDAAYEAGTPCQLNSDCPAEDDICWNLALCYRNKIARKALDLHNELRSDLAMGRVKNKAGTNYPTAAVMYRLDYDLDLEQAALDEAKKWNFVRSGRGAATAILGGAAWTNRAVVMPSDATSKLEALEWAINKWWAGSGTVGNSEMNDLFAQKHFNDSVVEFAQMANGDNSLLGCAVVEYNSKYNVVCQYKIKSYSGTPNKRVAFYERGKPCSKPCYSYSTLSCSEGLCPTTGTQSL